LGFFVTRPVFATVVALVISLLGVLALGSLAVEQYPNVAPPQVQVTAVYPGASPDLLENVVAAPLEREMSGVSGLLYMQSTSSSSGLMTLQVVFEPGTDLDIATVEVNNRVKRVEPLLPQAVLDNGVKVDKTNPAMLLIVTMQSRTGQFDRDFLSNLANSAVVPEVKRIGGVGDVTLFGYPYAMRVWLNPDQLAKFRLTVSDVAGAIREQNQNYAVGELHINCIIKYRKLFFYQVFHQLNKYYSRKDDCKHEALMFI
jgi:multidrug efflux pump subunit AcrB